MTNTLSVSNAEELESALASAKGGDTIALAGGDYGHLKLWDVKQAFIKYDAPVTITSADPGDMASFSEVVINGGKNIVFDSIVFDYQFDSSDSIKARPFEIKSSEGIAFRNSVFSGDVAQGISASRDGLGTAFGLSVRDSSDIAVEGTEFATWSHAALFSNIDGLVVRGNDIHDIRSDGLDFVSVRSAVIEDNYLHDFRDHVDSTSHRDMIQFWTNGTDKPSTDIVIRGNTLDIGEGSWTQSIFMRNEEVDTGRAGAEMFYRNLLIEDNVIHNAHGHGITVGTTDGLTIRGNTILRAEGEMHGLTGTVTTPKMKVSTGSQNVAIEDNITGAITGFEGQADWAMGNNVLVQPSEYLDHFITSSLATVDGANNFVARPDSDIENARAGASSTLLDDAPAKVAPKFDVSSSAEDTHTLIFDAGLTMGPVGIVSGKEADFIWSFGDGSTAKGPLVQHEFEDAGCYDVSLQVIMKDGTAAQVSYEVGISGDDILSFDQKTGQFKTMDYGADVLLDADGASMSQADGEMALRLGTDGVQASVARSHLSKFAGTDNFEMSMTLKADTGGEPWGEVARFHESFGIYIDQSGTLKVNLYPEDGSRPQLVSVGVRLNDGAAHDITIKYDGVAGEAQLVIDGTVNTSKAISGALGGGGWDLTFGNPSGKKNFEGELSAFSLSAESTDFPIHAGTGIPDAGPVPADPIVTPDIPEPEVPAQSDETDGAETAPPTPPQEEDSGDAGPLLLGGYKLDIASVETSSDIEVVGDAHVTGTGRDRALSFDGEGDSVALGRLTEFEASQRLAFTVDFTNDDTDGEGQRLVWNHLKLGLTLKDDGLHAHVGNDDKHFSKGFKVEGLGLDDGKKHSATVMVDAQADRLQIVVDDVLVFEETETDFDFVGAGGREWGWSLGTAWTSGFEGEVHGFEVTDAFDFVETAPVQEDPMLAI